MVHSAREIANWFLAQAYAVEDTGISNLKLQKILYYAQGHHLAKTGDPLFDDKICAWAHGPVVESIYHDFKQYGSSNINAEVEIPNNFSWDNFHDVDQELIKVWNTYGGFDAWKLRNMTHEESPWKDTFQDSKRNLVIPNEKIQSHFSSN